MPVKKNRPKLISTWLALLSIFILGLLFYTRCRIECVKIGYEINKEKAEHVKLDAKRNELIIELKRLKSPEYIEEQVARHKLRLKMPKPSQIIEIQ
jgi:cell division protein FtsB